MKPWKKYLFNAIAILATFFAAAYIFMVFKGKAIIISKLEGLTHKKVSIGSFTINPPFNLVIKDLNIEGLLKSESISVSPSILRLLLGNLAFNRVMIVKPELILERNIPVSPETAEGKTSVSAGQPEKVNAPAEPAIKKEYRLRLVFKRLNIKDGKVNFTDHSVGTEGIKINIKDINFNLSNFYTFPVSVITNFKLEGRIPWQQGQEEGKISAAGWMNLFKKDLKADLEISDIDGIYLYPYYSNWVDLEKARIEKAKLNFTSKITGLDNNLTAECHLELVDIVRKPRSPEEQQEKAEKIADAVLDMFKALNQGKIVLDFTIRTKMDRPEFSFGDIKMAFEDKLARARNGNGLKPEDILRLPVKVIKGVVTTARDLSKAMIDGTFAVGNEIKKTIEDSFKKEKKEAEPETKKVD